MELAQNSYPIVVERGVLDRLSALTDTKRKVLVVTDDGVPEKWVRKVLAQFPKAAAVTVAQGEGAKSFPVFQSLCEKLLSLRFTRSDAVIALGGGVVGDLAGFAAASYMRGIGFINLPTTVLSQVDSSIGGKVAINLNGIKNCVGAFYQPELVAVDLDTLSTLPPRHISNGLVEAVKAGLLGDSGLFELFEAEGIESRMEEIIHRSLAVKRSVVEQDAREKNLRKLLNLGHTIGHGVESVYGLEGGGQLLHGEAVAVGMLPMLDGEALKSRVEQVFAKLSIDPHFPYDRERVAQAIASDKKAHGDKITVVRVREPGEAYLEELSLGELQERVRKLA